MVAWLWSRSTDSEFVLRFEDLDTNIAKPEHYASQAEDLEAIGITWDGAPLNQTDRSKAYDLALNTLTERDLVYPCFCSRREIREAAQAPNGPSQSGHYPGTCRELGSSQRARRAQETGRPPALRFRGNGEIRSFDDLFVGPFAAPTDDFVIRRGDGAMAYNLVVVVDDAFQGVDLVVRADDLLDSTPRQILIAEALDLATPAFAHVPLVLNTEGLRLAKRDGAVTLPDRIERGETVQDVVSFLAHSLGLAEEGERVTTHDLIDRFDPSLLPHEPLVLPPSML